MKELLRNRTAILLSASFVVTSFIVLFNPNENVDLLNYYTDHLRHGTMSWLATQAGTDVYTHSMGDLVARVPPAVPHLNWEQHTYLYPPGALLVFLPFGLLENSLSVPTPVVYKTLLILLLAVAHLGLGLFLVQMRRVSVPLTWLVFPLAWLDVVHWTLNGFYDMLFVTAALAAVWWMGRKEYGKAVLLMALSLFLHFRASHLALVGLIALAEFLSSKPGKGVLARILVPSVLMGGLSIAAFAVGMLYCGDIPESNRMNLFRVGYNARVLLLFGVALAVFIASWRMGEMLTGMVVFFSTAIWLSATQIQDWHGLVLLPILVLPGVWHSKTEHRSSTENVAALTVLWSFFIFLLVIRQFPGFEWIVQLLEGHRVS